MDLINTYRKFQSSSQQLRDELGKVEVALIDDALADVLTSMLRDVNFEAKVFELLLKARPQVAISHLKTYYLQGEPSLLSRFNGNLDVMLDDFRIFLGEEALQNLLDDLPETTLSYPAIDNAIRFTRDD